MRLRRKKNPKARSPFIIDHRNELPWHQRYASTTSTALLWGIWILLWRPVMIILGFIGVKNPHIVEHILGLFLSAIEKGILFLLLAALILLLWNNFVPYKSFKRGEAKTIHDYANYFGFDAAQLKRAREQQIVTIHHDDAGHIVEIES